MHNKLSSADKHDLSHVINVHFYRHHAAGPQIVVIYIRTDELKMFSFENMAICAVFIAAGTTTRVVGGNNLLVIKPSVTMLPYLIVPSSHERCHKCASGGERYSQHGNK